MNVSDATFPFSLPEGIEYKGTWKPFKVEEPLFVGTNDTSINSEMWSKMQNWFPPRQWFDVCVPERYEEHRNFTHDFNPNGWHRFTKPEMRQQQTK